MHEELTAEQLAAGVAAAYRAAVAADNAWTRELERLFGKDAGDVRYTEQGRSGSTLAPLYEAYRRANDAWVATRKQQRGEA